MNSHSRWYEEPRMMLPTRPKTFVMILATLLTLALSFAAHSQTPARSRAADLILHNGLIWTVDSRNSTAEAVAIKDGKLVVVGSNRAALRLRGPRTEVIDLRGGFVTPGFNDNHVHFASAAQFLEFNIMTVSTQEQFVARVKDVIAQIGRAHV